MRHSRAPTGRVRFNLRKSSIVIRATLQGKGYLGIVSSLVARGIQGAVT